MATLDRLAPPPSVLRREGLGWGAPPGADAPPPLLGRGGRAAKERLGMVPARKVEYLSVTVEAPSDPLLPRPIIRPAAAPGPGDEPWWGSPHKALPFP